MRSGAPAASCLLGNKEQLILGVFGGAALTRVLGIGINYSVIPGAVTIAAGDWQAFIDISVPTGGGPQNRVRVQLIRYSSLCLTLTTIIDETIDVAKGVTAEYSTTIPNDPGVITFGALDRLQITLTDANGNQVKTLRYDNSTGTDADSRFTFPDEAPEGSEHLEGDGIWLDLGGPGPLGEY